ncbi:hypothetical protein LAG73_15025 [Pseudoxanthomonas japonensis]|nr:hypothetical protein LAG73_15025 [Pseudoxanthomonas japonensis]
MDTIWPWLAIAGLGALHGLHPANGWMFAAAGAIHAGRGEHAWHALWPIGIGHATAIVLIATAFAIGLRVEAAVATRIAGAALLVLACHHLWRRHAPPAPTANRLGAVGLALWSGLIATAHGLGMVLVPALVPLCLSAGPWRDFTASGSSSAALLAAVALHMTAMLLVTGALARGACHGWGRYLRHWRAATLRCLWSLMLAATGIVLLALAQ